MPLLTSLMDNTAGLLAGATVHTCPTLLITNSILDILQDSRSQRRGEAG